MAKLPSGMTVNELEVSQEIDLSKHVNFKLTDDLKMRVGQKILDLIDQRTASGKDISGNTFKGYSESYKNSTKFQAFGKSENVDLRLTGAMRATTTIEDQEDNKIKIKVDDNETAKAYGHMSGYKGHKTIKNGPKRKWFGVTQKDVKDVLREFKPILDNLESKTSAGDVLRRLRELNDS